MKNQIKILFIIFIFSILFLPKSVLAYDEALDFIFPLTDWLGHVTYPFGTKVSDNYYHLGDDVPKPQDTAVQAMANGYLRHFGLHTRYGFVAIIEYFLASGKKVCSVYGHLKEQTPLKEGDFIKKGETVGYLADENSNGGWTPHLHLGIKKGEYVDVNKDWVYWGYGNSEELKTWYDPTKFILDTTNPQDPPVQILTGAGFGGSAHIRIFNKNGKSAKLDQIAFSQSFRGGADVASGDVDGDGAKEIVVGAGPGKRPHIQIYSKITKKLISHFFAFDKNFKGGVRVTTGDINGDGKDEIIVGAGPGGGANVRLFNFQGKYLNWHIFPFGQDFKGGVDVATGDVDRDGINEIIVSQLSNGQAWIKVYKVNKEKTILANFLAYPSQFKGGAYVTSGDLDKDGQAEIITGAGAGGGPQVRTFEPDGKYKKLDFWPFDQNFKGGVDVGTADFDQDGIDEIIASQASMGQAWVKVYQYNKQRTILAEFLAYAPNFKGGCSVAGIK
jgi:hypothetical protein